MRNDFTYQNGRELGTEFCSGIGKAFAPACFLKYFDIAVVHYYDHGFGLTFGNQIIHDEVHLTLVGPACLIFSHTVLQVQYRVLFGRILIILCGCVDEASTPFFTNVGIIPALAY